MIKEQIRNNIYLNSKFSTFVMMKTLFLLLTISFAALSPSQVFAQDDNEASELFDEAKKHFDKAEYKEAIIIYDTILELIPYNISTLKMKGIALSNLGQDDNSLSYHQSSLKQFYRILQHDPNDVLALTGMGVGFGYLGEYQESKQYFQKAFEVKPDSVVITNASLYSALSKCFLASSNNSEASLLSCAKTWVGDNAAKLMVSIRNNVFIITKVENFEFRYMLFLICSLIIPKSFIR